MNSDKLRAGPSRTACTLHGSSSQMQGGLNQAASPARRADTWIGVTDYASHAGDKRGQKSTKASKNGDGNNASRQVESLAASVADPLTAATPSTCTYLTCLRGLLLADRSHTALATSELGLDRAHTPTRAIAVSDAVTQTESGLQHTIAFYREKFEDMPMEEQTLLAFRSEVQPFLTQADEALAHHELQYTRALTAQSEAEKTMFDIKAERNRVQALLHEVRVNLDVVQADLHEKTSIERQLETKRHEELRKYRTASLESYEWDALLKTISNALSSVSTKSTDTTMQPKPVRTDDAPELLSERRSSSAELDSNIHETSPSDHEEDSDSSSVSGIGKAKPGASSRTSISPQTPIEHDYDVHLAPPLDVAVTIDCPRMPSPKSDGPSCSDAINGSVEPSILDEVAAVDSRAHDVPTTAAQLVGQQSAPVPIAPTVCPDAAV
ncbi:hypothetical protein ANO11243_067970 [Dothideomycetidae sp. 11243]|nr:hypothetical protein ANO11243_067970 [fungal sp. No.11243]